MFSQGFTKFFALTLLIFFSAAACGSFQTGENNNSKTSAMPEEQKSALPFSNREPENFQAEIVTSSNGGEHRTLIAKNGLNQRFAYNYGTAKEAVVLRTNINYLILPNKKIYAENSINDSFSVPDEWQSFLTSEWLNQNTSAKFEKIGTTENITKYQVTLNEKAESEIYIYVDEKLGIPVKQEFFAFNGDEKSLVFSVEIKNLKLQPDENLFVLPADFKKVPIDDLRKVMSKSSE